ncbi:MAG TPA: cytochrome c biogenesis protein CcdA, partial [Myxococcota bacterium]|nr:cytochrome c biogenesis protein CcdA [Myxococcota bacterium]
FLFMALFMFGVFPLVVPSRLMNTLTKIGGSGFKGAFLMGTVAGLIAAPCTGPVLGFILAIIAEKQDILKGLWLMAAFSCGLGLPFLILGTFSSVIAHMPKSGRFMAGIKIVLGTVMLATSCYYAYLAWPKHTSTPLAQTLNWHIIDAQKIDFDAYILEAENLGQPILIDFYADWCVSCHELDAITYQDEDIINFLKNFFLIKVDASKEAAHLSTLHQRFGITGLPTTMIIATDKNKKPLRLLGFIPPDELLNALKRMKAD